MSRIRLRKCLNMHWLLNAVLWLAEELPTTEVIFDNNLAKWEKSSAKQNAKQYHWPSLSHSAHLSPRIRLFLILLTHNGDWNAKLQLRTKKQNAKKAKILRISKIYLASSPRCSIEVFWEFRCCLDLAITGGNRKKFCFFNYHFIGKLPSIKWLRTATLLLEYCTFAYKFPYTYPWFCVDTLFASNVLQWPSVGETELMSFTRRK